MYIMQWSRPEIYDATRNLARHMQGPRPAHVKALNTLIRYLLATPNCGLVIEPDSVWNGDKDFEFEIHGHSDSDYAGNVDDRRSISGGQVFLNGSPIVFRSATQKFVTLSVTEAETAAGMMVAQEMMYEYRI